MSAELQRIAEQAARAAMDAVLDHIEHPQRTATGSYHPSRHPALETWHLALAVGDDVRLAVLSGSTRRALYNSTREGDSGLGVVAAPHRRAHIVCYNVWVTPRLV